MLNYEVLAATIRQHSDSEIKLPVGFVRYGTQTDFENNAPLPRRVLREACSANGDEGLSDMWSLGLEWVLGRLPHDPYSERQGYELDLLGAYQDRGGFEYYGDEKPDSPETIISKLEDAVPTLVRFDWQSNYIVRAYGMQEVCVDLLAEWPGLKLYMCGIAEGEGWWGTLYFAVRKGDPC